MCRGSRNSERPAVPLGGLYQNLEIEEGHEAVVTIRDEGPGIAPDPVPQLFVCLSRGDPARRQGEGSGLGLAIARVGAEAHGGRLEYVGNAPGAVFRLTLPLAEIPGAV